MPSGYQGPFRGIPGLAKIHQLLLKKRPPDLTEAPALNHLPLNIPERAVHEVKFRTVGQQEGGQVMASKIIPNLSEICGFTWPMSLHIPHII
jgi:hypothetical protein